MGIKTAKNRWKTKMLPMFRIEPGPLRIASADNGPVDGKERLYTVDGKPIRLHPECRRFYLDRVYR
jgi:hypothetical protein